MISRALLLLGGVGALGTGATLVAGEVWVSLKASAARVLIDRAYTRHLVDGADHRPWSWADTHPIARLEVPRLGVRRTVLAGASGSSLAFGPGHVDGTARPNAPGNCVLAGHRDRWFEFLRDLRIGDRIGLETRGERREYTVVETRVISRWDLGVAASSADRRLTLVTCYPFGGVRDSPWRYVVLCEPSGGLPETGLGAGAKIPGTRAPGARSIATEETPTWPPTQKSWPAA